MSLRDCAALLAIMVSMVAGMMGSSLLIPVIIALTLTLITMVEHSEIYQRAWDVGAWEVFVYGLFSSLLISVGCIGAGWIVGQFIMWAFWS